VSDRTTTGEPPSSGEAATGPAATGAAAALGDPLAAGGPTPAPSLAVPVPGTAGFGGGGGVLRRVRPALMLILAVLLFAVAWEAYKAVGSDDGGSVFGVRVLPRADDASMPHVAEILSRLTEPEVSAPGSRSVAAAVGSAMWFTFRISAGGLLLGAVIGFALAVLMQRVRVAEAALLPYVVVSQTVPLVALAPLVVGWGGHLVVLGQPWQPWMSVMVISAYLAFFPVAVGALRGLQSPTRVQVELMHCYAAPKRQTLRVLRLPACVPYLIPALRLAAAASIVGAIVAEISTGTRGGIGRLIVEYAQTATGDPAKPFTALLGAALLGLLGAGAVGLLELALRRYRPLEPA
jgi:NitT/TauT family transport system permease protein